MAFAFVTGGSRGIGRAIVERLARDGFDVAFNYRRDDAAAADAERAVRAAGRTAVALKADLGDPGQVVGMLDALDAETTDVRVFVANAAATAFKPLLETKPHHVEKTYAITIGAFPSWPFTTTAGLWFAWATSLSVQSMRAAKSCWNASRHRQMVA